MSITALIDAQERQEAINPHHSFLVQAPAGSGKTELLSNRILALLALVSQPEEILAITFTRKAAAEMHERVMKKLQAAQHALDTGTVNQEHELAIKVLHQDATKKWHLLSYPTRLQIKTIDAFCAQLVKRMPYLSTMGTSPQQTEDAYPYYLQAALNTLNKMDTNEDVRFLVEYLDGNLNNASQLIARMLDKRDQWEEMSKEVPKAMHSMIMTLAQIIENALQELSDCFPWASFFNIREIIPASISYVTEKYGTPPKWEALTQWNETKLKCSLDQIKQWKALATLLLTKNGTLRKPNGIKETIGFPPESKHKAAFVEWIKQQDENAPWVAQLFNILNYPDELLTENQAKSIAHFIEVIKLASKELKHIFSQESCVDFIEVASNARYALGTQSNPSELLAKIDGSIHHILVDEFQDTSLAQIQLLRTLMTNWQNEDGRTLFLVGDPMQSIYSFRKADVSLFLRLAKDGFIQTDTHNYFKFKVLTLKVNFRSQAVIVDWVNKHFKTIFPKENNIETSAIQYTPSTAFHPALDDSVHINHFFASSNNKELTRSELKRNIDCVVELCKNALNNYPDSNHPIAILVRNRNHAMGLLSRLNQEGIPVNGIDLISLSEYQSVIDLCQLIKAVTHPADRLAWTSVLRSPLCGLSLASLTNLLEDYPYDLVMTRLLDWYTESSKQSDIVSDSYEASRLRRFCEIMLPSYQKKDDMSFTQQIEALWLQLGGYEFYNSQVDHRNIETVLNLLDNLAPFGQLDMDLFDRKIQNLYASSEGSTRAVEVMTMHKAKGLQFEEVILYDLQRYPKTDDPELLYFEQVDEKCMISPIKHHLEEDQDPITKLLSSRKSIRLEHELQRLLYVAATRACKRLHLFVTHSINAKGTLSSARQSTLWRCLEPSLLASDMSAEDVFQSWLNQQNIADRISDLSEAQDDIPGCINGYSYLTCESFQDLINKNPSKSLNTEKVNAWINSYCSLHNSSQPSSTTNEQEQTLNIQWGFLRHTKAHLGIVAHQFLSWFAQDPKIWTSDYLHASKPLIRLMLIQTGCNETTLEEACEELLMLLTPCLTHPQLQSWWNNNTCHPEYPLVDQNNRKQIIDLLIDLGADGYAVIDYKTSHPFPNEAEHDFIKRLKQKYQSQIDGYCQSIQEMTGKPCHGYLFSLTLQKIISYK